MQVHTSVHIDQLQAMKECYPEIAKSFHAQIIYLKALNKKKKAPSTNYVAAISQNQ